MTSKHFWNDIVMLPATPVELLSLELRDTTRPGFQSENLCISVLVQLQSSVDFITLRGNLSQHIQCDRKVSVHLMITTQKITSNVQSVPRQSPDVY
jgi:hypothetical protein